MIKENLTLSSDKLNEYSLVDGLSLQNLYFVKNNEFPSVFMLVDEPKHERYIIDTEGLMNYLMKEMPPSETIRYNSYTHYNLTTKEKKKAFTIILEDRNIFARFEKEISVSYILYDTKREKELDDFVKIVEKFYIPPKLENNNMFIVSQDNYGFNLSTLKTNGTKELDIDSNYNDDFGEKDKTIKTFIEKDNTAGLIILHGDKGTGKSTYIRHLIACYPEKKFIFIPASLIQMLGQPTFTSFLLTLENSIIILEDCENAIKSRKGNSGSAGAVALLLNMADGLIGDNLALKFICTFNEDVRDIDDALLRKGRCACKYEFKALSPEKTSELLKKVKDIDYNGQGLTLSEIYFYGDTSYTNERTKIGL